jgi:hypothetical protein
MKTFSLGSFFSSKPTPAIAMLIKKYMKIDGTYEL